MELAWRRRRGGARSATAVELLALAGGIGPGAELHVPIGVSGAKSRERAPQRLTLGADRARRQSKRRPRGRGGCPTGEEQRERERPRPYSSTSTDPWSSQWSPW
jgi:hypothetical protein